MSYVERTLSYGETILGKADYHWSWYTAASWPLVLGIIAAVLSIWVLEASVWLALALFVLGTILTIAAWIPLLAVEIAVTSQRIVFKKGWLKRRVEELGLRAIEEINLSQTVLGRMLGYGSIIAFGTGESEIRLPPIAKPIDFRRRIEEARRMALYEDRA